MHRALSLLFLVLRISSTLAQSKWTDDLEIEINHGYGYVLPEYEFVNLVVKEPTETFEFSLRKNTYGKSVWEQYYQYPSYGLRGFYSDLGSPDVFGQAWGIYPFIQLPFYYSERFRFFNQIGLGYSRVNKKFDQEHNYLNVAVGSYSNIHFNLRFIAELKILEKIYFKSALSFDHFSNGNAAEPNLGINYISWMNGLSYSIGKRSERIQDAWEKNEAEWETEIMLAIGGKHSRALSSQYYQTNALSLEFRKNYFRLLHFGIGADFFYDSSVKDQLKKQERSFKGSNSFQTGIHLSQTLIYHNFSFSLHQGIYMGLTEKVDHYSIYNRAILKYKVHERISARFMMKSHLHILDYPEIGIGYFL